VSLSTQGGRIYIVLFGHSSWWHGYGGSSGYISDAYRHQLLTTMEQAKKDISSIIDRVNSSFPEGNDIKGFSGISKALVIASLTDSLQMLGALEPYDNQMETIFLKRELAEITEHLKDDISVDFDRIKNGVFNSFLRRVSRVKFILREAYISVTAGQPIRTEAEIAQSKADLLALTDEIEALKKVLPEVTALKDSTTQGIADAQAVVNGQREAVVKNIAQVQAEVTALREDVSQKTQAFLSEQKTTKEAADAIHTDMVAKQKQLEENQQKVATFLGKLVTDASATESISKNTATWEQEIKSTKEQIAANSADYAGLAAKAKSTQLEIDQAYERIFGKPDESGRRIGGYLKDTEDLKAALRSFLDEQEIKYAAQFTHIESLLPGATSAGLAEAFEKQKKSYNIPIFTWSAIFITITLIMTGCSIYLFYVQFLKPGGAPAENFSQGLLALLRDLPFFIPTIWLAVFASKQQSQFKRLQQEYAFKEINAKSFYGHKKQIEELGKDGDRERELLLQLIAQLVLITAQNPSETLDNKSHNDSPPVFQLFEKLLKRGGNETAVQKAANGTEPK